MSCLICAGQAESIECQVGWEQRSCAACGDYCMSQALVAEMMEQGQIFDAARMRNWLLASRGDTPLPMIEASHAILMR